MILFFLEALLWPIVRMEYRLREWRLLLRARLPFSALVLDIGSGNRPWFRSNVLCDRYLIDDVERGSGLVTKGLPLCNAEATALPFADGSIDFVFCSHIAEHIDDLGRFLREIQRVGKRGYIETPNYLFEQSVGTTTHHWALWTEGKTLHAERKWVAGAPARVYDGMHGLFRRSSLFRFAYGNIPELRAMAFWWEGGFEFVLHDAPEPLALTKSNC